MPELPEVETTIRDLRKKILNRTFINVWTDFKKIIKKPNFDQFRKEIKNKKIQKIWRRGKNIIFELSEGLFLLIHQKLTGHLLLGKWRLKNGQWISKTTGPLIEDPINKFLHLIFWLDNGQQLALSDLRKFAKVELLNQKKLQKELDSLGPEPLEKKFVFQKFKKVLPKKGKIKQILMNQNVIAGIGNIYSDEILWQVKIHPFKDISNLSQKKLKEIYQAIKKILSKAIKLGGESISNFRRISGEKGYFDRERRVYRREGKKCSHCQIIIKKIKLGGRSAYYCPNCQKL